MERTRNDNKSKKRTGKQEGKVTIGFSFASDLSKLSRPIKEGSQPKFMRSRITLNMRLKIKRFPLEKDKEKTLYIHIFICAAEVNLLASNHL